jgi:hypothetical protein
MLEFIFFAVVLFGLYRAGQTSAKVEELEARLSRLEGTMVTSE